MKKKNKLIFNVVALGIALLVAALLTYAVYNFEKAQAENFGLTITFAGYWPNLLLDGFGITTLIYLGLFGFAYVSLDAGIFDIFTYSFKKFGSSLWFRFKKTPNPQVAKTYSDYKLEKMERPRPYYNWLLNVALILALITIVFLIIYLGKPLNYPTQQR